MVDPVYEVAIIGAGPGGIAAAHLLRQKYHRPQTITGARCFSRRSPLSDYVFSRRLAMAQRPVASEPKELPA
jgi:2-polyprenyl-6-methoxyphenol hydroxylase-like FAD-dependent oxidoreductase